MPVDANCHDDREDDHERDADGNANNHAIGVLDVGHVRCHAGNQGGCRETIDVSEREVLNLEEEVLTQVLCQPRCCGRTEAGGEDAEEEGEHRHDQHNNAKADNWSERTTLKVIDQRGHNQWEEALKNDLSRDKQRCQKRSATILTHTSQQSTNSRHLALDPRKITACNRKLPVDLQRNASLRPG